MSKDHIPENIALCWWQRASILPSFTHWKSAVSRFLSSFLSSLSFSCLLWLPRCRRAKTLIPSFAPLTGRARRSRCLAGLCLSGPPRCRGWLLNHRYSSYKFSFPCCAGPCEATCLAGQCSSGLSSGLTAQQCICGCSFHFLIAVRIEPSVCRRSVFLWGETERVQLEMLFHWMCCELMDKLLVAESRSSMEYCKMAHVSSLMTQETDSKQLDSEPVNVFTFLFGSSL